MRHNLTKVVLLASALGACAQNRPETMPTQPVSTNANCPAPPEPSAPSLGTVSGVPGQPPLALHPPAPTFQGRSLLPPTMPGSSKFELSGCLSMANPTEAEGASFPPPISRAEAAPPEVRVNPMARGAIVVHELTHACCLKADVSTRLEGERLVVLERLTGSPCRCLCASTVRTAVGLAPGHYLLSLQLSKEGKTSVVRELPVTVENTTP